MVGTGEGECTEKHQLSGCALTWTVSSSLNSAIRLPGGDPGLRGYSSYSSDSGVLATLASVPWFLVGLGGIAYEWVAERVDSAVVSFQGRRGYRNLPVDEDAQILRFEDEE